MISCASISQQERKAIQRKWMMIEYRDYIKSCLIEKKAFIDLRQPESAPAFMGCNTMAFQYKISSTSNISFNDGITTEMACPEMNLESNFLQDIIKVQKFQVDGHKLTLTGEGVRMIFIAEDWD